MLIILDDSLSVGSFAKKYLWVAQAAVYILV